jgi:hypothetical protein
MQQIVQNGGKVSPGVNIRAISDSQRESLGVVFLVSHFVEGSLVLGLCFGVTVNCGLA